MTNELRNRIAHLSFEKKDRCKYCIYSNECSDFIEDCESFQPKLDLFED